MHLRRIATLCAAATLLPSCSLDAENFGKKFAKASCGFEKRCIKAPFFYEFDDMAECIDKRFAEYEEQAQLYVDCTFDPDFGRECLRAYGDSCATVGEDLYANPFADCDKVWDCY